MYPNHVGKKKANPKDLHSYPVRARECNLRSCDPLVIHKLPMWIVLFNMLHWQTLYLSMTVRIKSKLFVIKNIELRLHSHWRCYSSTYSSRDKHLEGHYHGWTRAGAEFPTSLKPLNF